MSTPTKTDEQLYHEGFRAGRLNAMRGYWKAPIPDSAYRRGYLDGLKDVRKTLDLKLS